MKDKINIAVEAFNKLPEKGSYKSVSKLLNTISENLPNHYYPGNRTKVDYIVDISGKELKNSTIFEPEARIDISSNGLKPVYSKDTTFFKSNHKRRIRDIWNKEGKRGVYNYFLKVGRENKITMKIINNKMVTELVNYKVKSSITEIL